MRSFLAVLVTFGVISTSNGTPTNLDDVLAPPAPPPGTCSYPANCPNKVLPRADKQVRTRAHTFQEGELDVTPKASVAKELHSPTFTIRIRSFLRNDPDVMRFHIITFSGPMMHTHANVPYSALFSVSFPVDRG